MGDDYDDDYEGYEDEDGDDGDPGGYYEDGDDPGGYYFDHPGGGLDPDFDMEMDAAFEADLDALGGDGGGMMAGQQYGDYDDDYDDEAGGGAIGGGDDDGAFAYMLKAMLPNGPSCECQSSCPRGSFFPCNSHPFLSCDLPLLPAHTRASITVDQLGAGGDLLDDDGFFDEEEEEAEGGFMIKEEEEGRLMSDVHAGEG